MDTNTGINESCKEASYEGVTLKFVKLKDANHGKRLDPIWSYFLRSAESKYNRYIALCMYCNKTMSGRLHFMRKHITDECHVISSEDRATFMRSMNDKDSPVNLTDEMKASSQRRFEMKSEAEVDKTATKRKNTGSKISAFMEQKLDKKSQEPLHIMLLQALIWGNISFNFVNNPFFIRFLSKLRPSYCLPYPGSNITSCVCCPNVSE